jgi:AraC family transcriptional regulator
MEPGIITLPEKKFVGKRISMAFADNRTMALWKGFMPKRKTIRNSLGTELYSIEVYPPLFFDDFNPAAVFEKWAAVEVSDFQTVPDDMETLVSPEGLYAVFIHKGPASAGPKTYRYIFETWLPGSGYVLEHRPHFAIMGEKYKNDDPGSEEEIWIPVKAVGGWPPTPASNFTSYSPGPCSFFPGPLLALFSSFYHKKQRKPASLFLQPASGKAVRRSAETH